MADVVSPGVPETGAFQLGHAQVGGRPRMVAVAHGGVYLLDDLLGGEGNAPSEPGELYARWTHWHAAITATMTSGLRARPVEVEQWHVPVAPSKLVCIGTNYRDHLREMGNPDPPALPYAFLKPVKGGIVPSGAPVLLPRQSRMVDWEAELAIVIGTRLRNVTGPDVLDAIAGYTIINDLSARDWIASAPAVGIDWVMMKGHDGFSPLGPVVTPAEFVADPQRLPIRCWVNGELKQDSSTAEMIFGVQQILEHVGAIMTLEPGDVVATGTPAGVGFGHRPPQFLADGDVVAVEIEGLGRLETVMSGAAA